MNILGSASCYDLNWLGENTGVQLHGSKKSILTIYGSLNLHTSVQIDYFGQVRFRGSEQNLRIKGTGQLWGGNFYFEGNGSWIFAEPLRTSGDIYLLDGTTDANRMPVSCRSMVRPINPQPGLMRNFINLETSEGWKVYDASTGLLHSAPNSFISTSKNGNDSPVAPLATVTVSCPPLTLTITGTDPSCNGSSDGSASVAVTGGNPPYTYLWTPSGATTSSVTGLNANTYLVEVWDNIPVTPNYCSGSIALVNPSAMVVNITPPAPVTSCFGVCDGQATASPSGGTPPYTYSWNTVPVQTTALATGLCSQVYSVTVTDNKGCVRVRAVNIGQPALLVANGSSTTINCFGNCNGTAQVAPSGGNVPYTYSWAPGGFTTSAVSGLCAGVITCTVTDTKGCMDIYSTTITQPTVLTATVSGNNLLCNGVCTGSVSATASGGIGAYTYTWNPGGFTTSSVTGLCANTYTLTLKDANNCTYTTTIAVTQPSALNTSPGVANIPCFGACNGSVSINPTGGTLPYTYAWLPGGCSTDTCSSLCPNTYSVTVTDGNGCTATNSATVTQPSQLNITPSKTDVVCPGMCNGTATASVGGGTAPYTYSWAPGGATTSAITGLCAGNYTVIATDANGCKDTAIVVVNVPSPLLPNLSATNVSCFSLCTGTVNSSPTGGTPGYTYLWNPGGYTTASVTGLCAGTYTLSLTDANGCPASSSITITQPPAYSAIISSATPNPLNCNGDCNGTAAVSVIGGTPLYSYSWTTGATTASVSGLCAGSYSVTVTDGNGCTSGTSVTFIQPTTLTVNIASSNPSCFTSCDGSAAAVAGGGTPGYSFLWQPGGQTTAAIGSLCAGTYTLQTTDSKGCVNTQTVTLTAPAALNTNTNLINVSCSGLCDGAASSTPLGGTAPYTFLWSGGQTTSSVSGLCAGNYTITVSDAGGCADVDVFTITQPAVMSSNVSSTTSSCTLCNGTATVTTTGGTVPYSFLWSDGQTTSAAIGLCPTNYTVDITDANGCTNSLTVTISPVVTLTVTVSGSSVSCNGSCDGMANATPFGGSAPYTYAWTTAPVQTSALATGLCSGTYTVGVSDANGCISSNTITFTNPPALTTTVSSTSASCGLCNGTASVNAAGGTGSLTYSWSGFPVQTTTTATGLCTGNYTVTVTDANSCTTSQTVTVGNIPTISANASMTPPTVCGGNDGSICAAPTGGTPAYTYSWMPGGATTSCVTGLTAGIYTLTITDNAGCSVPFPLGLGNATGPTVTITSQANPLCNAGCDGSISANVSGASPPFTYLWAPSGQTTTSATGLCAGTHIIQAIDAMGCSTLVSVVLTNPAQLAITPTINNVSCSGGNDGSVCLAVSGGSAPYTYNWAPGGASTSCVSGLIVGNYTVVVADAQGCDDTLIIPITAPTAISATVTSTNVTCNGLNNGTASVSVSGGSTPYTYNWSTGSPLPSVVGLAPGTYSVVVSDNNGCTTSSTVTITQPTALTSTLTSSNISCNSLCDGMAAIAVSGGTAAYTYSWNPGGATTTSITGLCPGNFTGLITDANGCTTSQSVTITQPSAITASVTTVNASCAGGCDGSASVLPSGGTGSYTYSWNPGGFTTSSATGLCTGNYTVQISDANGCTINSIFTISSPPVLQPNITTTAPLCFGGCDGSALASPVGGTGPYTYAWSTVPVQTTANATGLCAGTYTLTLSDANGCNINQTFLITAPPALTQVNGVAPATCNLCNGSITLIASGGTAPYTFQWSTGATTANLTGLCAGVYIDSIIDANGCISTDTIPVSNSTGPAYTTAQTNVTCYNLCNGTASANGITGDGPPWIYLWTFTGQTTQTATGLCAGQHFITVEDTNGCKTITPVNITQPAQLLANPSVNNATCFGICNGSIATSASGGTGAYTYLWSPGNQTTSSLTGLCTGTYTLTLTDANGCVQTSTITVGQNTLLTSTVTSTAASCNALCNGTAAISMNGGTLPYTYSWNPGGATTTSVTGLCAGTHTITVTDAIGCIRIDSAVITQPAVLNANLTIVNPLCTSVCNGSVTAAPSGGTAPYTYLWSTTATTTSITGLCAGNYSLSLTDANNCVSTQTFALTDPALLTATFSVTNATCQNTCDGSIDLTPAGGTGAYTYNWSNGSTTQDVSALCPGNYSVSITDNNGCVATYTMNVGAITVVTAMAGNDTSFCQNGTATLTSSSINATSIAWYQITAPTWTFIANTPSITQNPAVGTTSYALIAFNGTCSDTDTVNVVVNAYPVLISSNDTSICQGDSVTLCSSGAGSYQWYTLPAWTPVATGSCATFGPGVGIANYVIIGMNGVCSDTDTVAVNVLVLPTAIAGNDTSACPGVGITLCSNSLNSTSVAWYSLPGFTPVDTTNCVTVNPSSGLNNYVLVASNGLCNDTDTVAVQVYPIPFVDAGNGATILAGSTVPLNGSASGTYVWSPATGLSNVTSLNPTASPTITTTYSLTVTDSLGCTWTDTVTIVIMKPIIPNDGISPNNDGKNDIWEIPYIEMYPGALVEVYNRWGQLLFSTTDYINNKWNGTYKGSELPVGTYYYVINLNNDLVKDPITGPITILR